MSDESDAKKQLSIAKTSCQGMQFFLNLAMSLALNESKSSSSINEKDCFV